MPSLLIIPNDEIGRGNVLSLLISNAPRNGYAVALSVFIPDTGCKQPSVSGTYAPSIHTISSFCLQRFLHIFTVALLPTITAILRTLPERCAAFRIVGVSISGSYFWAELSQCLSSNKI